MRLCRLQLSVRVRFPDRREERLRLSDHIFTGLPVQIASEVSGLSTKQIKIWNGWLVSSLGLAVTLNLLLAVYDRGWVAGGKG